MTLAKSLVCSMLLACAQAAGSIGPPPGDFRTATVVFVGDIVGGSAVDLGSRVLCKVIVRAERFVKGDGVSGAEFHLSWEYEPYGMMPPEEARSVPREHGLWMLERAEDGSFTPLGFAPRDRNLGGVYLRLPAIQPNANLAYAPDASPEMKLAAELASALEAVAEAEGSNLNVDWNANELRSPMTDVRQDFQAVIYALAAAGPAATFPVYRYFLESTIPNLRAIGLSGVLSSGDTDAVFLLEREVSNLNTTLGASHLAVDVWDLRLDQNLPAAHALARVAVGETEVRGLDGPVALKLGKLKRAEFVPYLAVMLESPDLITRDEAIFALCDALRPSKGQGPQVAGLWKPEFAEYCPLGAPIVDPAVERKDVLFWKQWWMSQREQFELDDSFPRPIPPVRYTAAHRLEGHNVEIPVELRFDAFVSLISSFQRDRPVPPSDSLGAPTERALLLPCLSPSDDQTLGQIVQKLSSSLDANTTKVKETMNAYRIQGRPQNDRLLQGIEDERPPVLRNGMEELRRDLSPDGWQAVEKLIVDMVAFNACRIDRISPLAGH